jgi:hypothetical protein
MELKIRRVYHAVTAVRLGVLSVFTPPPPLIIYTPAFMRTLHTPPSESPAKTELLLQCRLSFASGALTCTGRRDPQRRARSCSVHVARVRRSCPAPAAVLSWSGLALVTRACFVSTSRPRGLR